MLNLNCDPKGIASEPINCNLTFLTQDPTLVVEVESTWNSFLGGKFASTFGISNCR